MQQIPKKKFLKVIDEKEAEKFPDEPKVQQQSEAGYRVLAVTACPTGIAHTYMAAEALEKKPAKSLVIQLRLKQTDQAAPKTFLPEKK